MVAEIVEYECTTDGVAEKQDVKINVELTVPDDATAGQQMSISWLGRYVDGSELRAPAAGLTGVKLYAYAALTGIEGLTSATGVSEPMSVAAGQTIPIPEAVSLKTTSSKPGTAKVRPAAINIGPSPTTPVIECEVQNAAALTTSTLIVAQDGQTSTTPTPDDATMSPKPTRTVTATVTAAASDEDDVDEEITAAQEVDTTPVGGAATGGGGEAGPDGRMYVLTGFVITLAAFAGLLLRRRYRAG
ncbi:hypothetical protein [Microbispora sp. NBRC 16548]|uniref:hypothetical protein n=1 Tax=Microbispora sp. NBRC 16548 TaxID=3030994 RepID=UPI0025547A87|nr:hypothetical protein [Microbispora sp. NBRC 16548]